MFMERSLFVDDELYGDEPRERTALNWPPPMSLPELPAACGPVGALPAAAPEPEELMPQTHFLARAARAGRGPILVLGTAVTVALSGGYAAGHAFGWKMPPKLRASVSPAVATFINEQIPALVARPGAPLWCPAEESVPSTEERAAERAPSRQAEDPGMDGGAGSSRPTALFELATADRPATISVVPRLRRPFQGQERPAPPWRGVVWSPRENRLVSVSTPRAATAGLMSPPLVH